MDNDLQLIASNVKVIDRIINPDDEIVCAFENIKLIEEKINGALRLK